MSVGVLPFLLPALLRCEHLAHAPAVPEPPSPMTSTIDHVPSDCKSKKSFLPLLASCQTFDGIKKKLKRIVDTAS